MNNFYETNSSRPINEGVNNVITKADSILRPYSNTASIVKDTAGVIFKGYKLIMAEKGLIRQIITGNKVESSPTKDGTGTLRDSGLPHLTQTQNINNTLIDRYDKSKDYYFRTGDYFLPLSFTISTSGEKKIEESQIIDGINVVERIAFAPIIAEISVKIEMAESKEENLWLTKVPNEYATIGQSQITELNMMLNDLNKNNEVFKIENNILNANLGIDYVFMHKYSIIPNNGSTIWNLKMTLQEVNVQTNLLYAPDETVSSYNIDSI